MAGLSVPTRSSYDRSRQKGKTASVDTLDRTGFSIVELLEKCYKEDYTDKETELTEDSGWRSLVYIARALSIPRSRVYGDKRRQRFFSGTLENLIESGKVEYRVFQEERGRGGRVVKVRVRPLSAPTSRRHQA